jgi:hypothetical protein
MLADTIATTGVRAPEGYAVARQVDEDSAELAWTDDPRDADRLVFTTPSGYPVRHDLFYKRTFKPAVIATLPTTPTTTAAGPASTTYATRARALACCPRREPRVGKGAPRAREHRDDRRPIWETGGRRWTRP